MTFAGYRLVLRRQRPLLTDGFLLPTLKDGPAPVVGASLFASVGLSGFAGPGHRIAPCWPKAR